MTRDYLSGPEAGDLLVDTVVPNESGRGFHTGVRPLREVLAAADKAGVRHVWFQPPQGMAEASAGSVAPEDIPHLKNGTLLTRTKEGWTYTQKTVLSL